MVWIWDPAVLDVTRLLKAGSQTMSGLRHLALLLGINLFLLASKLLNSYYISYHHIRDRIYPHVLQLL